MTYRFPLQRVLDVKEKEKQQAQQDLGVSLKKQHDVEEKMTALSEKRTTIQEHMIQQSRGCKALELHDQQRYITHLDRQIVLLQNNLLQTKKEVEKNQGVLMEKSKEEKIWQEWKQEMFTRHQQVALKQEQEMLDEMASIRYFRKQNML